MYQLSSSTKQQITVMAGMNAIGNYIPSVIIFPGQRLRDVGITGYPEAYYGVSDNGRMNSEIFLAFLKYFVNLFKEKCTVSHSLLFCLWMDTARI